MAIQVSCRVCRTVYQFPDEVRGRDVRCKTCSAVFVAEPTDAVQAAPIPHTPASESPEVRLPKPRRSYVPLIIGLLIAGMVCGVLMCAGLAALGFYRYKRLRDEVAMQFQQVEVAVANDVAMANEDPLVNDLVVDDAGPRITPADYINRVHVQFSDQQRFGLLCPRLRDAAQPEIPKRLTRDERGMTNNTIVRVDGGEFIWGTEAPGVRYIKERGRIQKEVPIPGKDKDRAWQSIWEIEGSRVRVTQSVELILGEQTRLFDTALVKYHIWNRDKMPHTVGLRVLLDSFTGLSDSATFTIPPSETSPARLEEKLGTWDQANLPSFVQALEGNDLARQDALLAVIGLKVRGYDAPEKLVLCRWPQNTEARWGGGKDLGDWQYEPMDRNPNARDGCALIYWPTVIMQADEHRDLAFTYGLGRVPADLDNPGDHGATTNLRLTAAPGIVAGKPFVVLAYAKGAPGTQVTLKLPAGLALADGKLTQTVPTAGQAGYGVAGWRVHAERRGQYRLEVQGPDGTARETVAVGDVSIHE